MVAKTGVGMPKANINAAYNFRMNLVLLGAERLSSETGVALSILTAIHSRRVN